MSETISVAEAAAKSLLNVRENELRSAIKKAGEGWNLTDSLRIIDEARAAYDEALTHLNQVRAPKPRR